MITLDPVKSIDLEGKGPRSSVFLVEDDPMVGQLFENHLAKSRRFQLAGIGTTLVSSISAIELSRPDLVFLDINMPDGDGLNYLSRLRAASPASRFFVCTARDDEALVIRAMQSDLDGLIHKHDISTATSFLATLKAIASQDRYVSESMAKVIESLRDQHSFFKLLSNRELELLPYFGRDCPNIVIGKKLGISPETVHSHRQKILFKLNLHTSSALVAWCVRYGFVDRRSFETDV